MTLFLNFRIDPVGGSVRKVPGAERSRENFSLASLETKAFVNTVNGRDILFAIHGYNNSQAEAVCALSRLEGFLHLPPTAVFVGILWPGDSHAGFVSYPVEKPTASYVGRQFATFCDKQLQDAASISFVSHSLGARVALETVRGLKRTTRSVCLMAAAIERHCLEKEYADAFAKTDTTYVLASEKDTVLRLAFPLGNFFGHLLDPTSSPLSKALGYSGPPRPIGKTVRPWQIDPKLDYEHGEYLPPSNANQPIPDKPAPWVETAGFVRRAFNLEKQIWPTPG